MSNYKLLAKKKALLMITSTEILTEWVMSRACYIYSMVCCVDTYKKQRIICSEYALDDNFREPFIEIANAAMLKRLFADIRIMRKIKSINRND